AEAEASLWIDGKRIYEATVALELVDGEGPARALPRRADPAPWPDGRVDLDAVGRFWREHLGVGRPWVAEDLYLALVARFVRSVRVDEAAREALRAGPVLYLANHQTAIETLMFSIVLGAVSGVPMVTLAKKEHRTSRLARLPPRLLALPNVRQRLPPAHFAPADPPS